MAAPPWAFGMSSAAVRTRFVRPLMLWMAATCSPARMRTGEGSLPQHQEAMASRDGGSMDGGACWGGLPRPTSPYAASRSSHIPHTRRLLSSQFNTIFSDANLRPSMPAASAATQA